MYIYIFFFFVIIKNFLIVFQEGYKRLLKYKYTQCITQLRCEHNILIKLCLVSRDLSGFSISLNI